MVVVVAICLQSLSYDFSLLLALRFIEGAAGILVVITLPAMIADCARPADRDIALAFWGTYFPFGAALSIAVSPLVLQVASWRLLWLLAALSVLVTLFAVTLVETPDPHKTARSDAQFLNRLSALLTSPAAWLLMLSFFVYNMAQGPLLAWLPSYMMDERGITPGLAGGLTALVVATNAIGVMAGGWLLTLGIQHWQIVALSGVIILATSMGMFLPDIADSVRLLSAVGLSCLGGLLPGAVFASIPRYAPGPEYLAGMTGIIIQGAQAGHLLAPPVFAWIIVSAGGNWTAGLWQYIPCAVLIVLLALALRRLAQRSAV